MQTAMNAPEYQDAIAEHGEAFALFFENTASGTDLETAIEQFQDAFEGIYDSLEEWAEGYVESAGLLESMPESLRHYFDYASFARDCDCNGDVFALDMEDGRLAVFNGHY